MAELVYSKVVGTFRGFVADTDDADDLPEFAIPSGSGVITPNVRVVKLNDGVLPPRIFYPSPINVTLDSNGQLSQGGRPYVNVLAPNDDMTPNSFAYSIIMNLKFDNNSRTETWGPYFFVPTGGSTFDLFNMTITTSPPLPTSSGGTTYVEDPNNPGYFIPA